jgi:hypothetical protein
VSLRDPDFGEDLPSRWEDEPRGRYDPGEKYLLERELGEGEAEYQGDLRKMLEREARNQRRHFYQGDLLGLEDGRPGLSLGMGIDGPTLYSGFSDRLSGLWLWLALVAIMVILAFIVRANYGSLKEYDERQPQTGQPAPTVVTPR